VHLPAGFLADLCQGGTVNAICDYAGPVYVFKIIRQRELKDFSSAIVRI